MGKISHADKGLEITRPEWKDASLHTIGGVTGLNIVRSATAVVAANDASAASKAQADFVCDGTADDVEIQAAINALPSGGGRVLFSEGQFSLSTKITPSSNLSLEGQGEQTILKLANGVNTNLIEYIGSSHTNITLEKMKFDGNKANQTADSTIIRLRNVAGLFLKDLVITEAYTQAIHLDGNSEDVTARHLKGTNAGANLIAISGSGNNFLFDDIYLSGAGSNQAILFNSNATGGFGNIMLNHIHIKDSIGSGIDIGGGGTETSPGPVKLHHILIEGLEDDAVSGKRRGISFMGSAFDNATKELIDITVRDYAVGTDTGDAFSLRGDNGKVIGCHAEDSASDGFALGSSGNPGHNWEFIGCSSVNNGARGFTLVIMNSRLCDLYAKGNAGDAGISLHGAQDNTWSNIQAWNTGIGAGLRLRDDGTTYSKRNIFLGGVLSDDQGTPTQTYGIQEGGSSDYNTYMGITISGYATGKATFVGANDIIRNNPGYITENSGTGTILSGNTSLVVAHGCDATPTKINIEFREQGTNDYGRWWVDTIGATNFTLHVSADPGASNLGFAWEAKVR